MAVYEAGTLILTQNSTQVEGLGTSFLNYVHAGDILTVNSVISTVASVEGNHKLTLTTAWSNASLYRTEYSIECLPITNRLEDYRKETTKEINRLAGEKILSVVPDWKQRNLTARMIELMSLNQVGSAEWTSIADIWAWVGSIRSASNTANNSVTTAVDTATMDTAKQSFIAAISTL